jgi:hypothetical protein
MKTLVLIRNICEDELAPYSKVEEYYIHNVFHLFDYVYQLIHPTSLLALVTFMHTNLALLKQA